MRKFNRDPDAEWLRANPDESRFIPINTLEDILDDLNWSTRNFHHMIFKDGYANLVVSASLELVIKYTDNEGSTIERSFVGAANFSIKSIDPNQHFLATVKSECIKNAASDIGKTFGRHLNDNLVSTQQTEEKQKPKSKPDSKIMQKFLKAVEDNDEATITMLSNIYDIKVPNAEEK